MKTTNTTTIELTKEDLTESLIAKYSALHPNKKVLVRFVIGTEYDPTDYFAQYPPDHVLSKVIITIE